MSTGCKVETILTKPEAQLHLAISNPEATVQDLLEAWQPLCSRSDLPKKYAPHGYGDCEACVNNCCNAAYIIPDLLAFEGTARLLGLSHKEYLERCFDPGKRAAGLLRWKSEPCMFLEDLRCSIYSSRSLLCRFYLCTPMDGYTEELIYKIAWTGAAATLVFARRQGWIPDLQKSSLDSFDRLVAGLMDDYSSSTGVDSFLGAGSYANILLKDFI